MNYLETEKNIIAIATSAGVGSIDVIRISGLDLSSLYAQLTKNKKTPKANTIKLKNIYSCNSDKLLDSCLISFFKAPRSFTGDDIIEINTHGGGVTAQEIVEDIVQSSNARMALPGEFMFRAYYNNKIDIIQAEAINDIIKADTGLHKKLSLENVQGKLSKHINNIKKIITYLLKNIEHELDFDESEIEHISNQNIIEQLDKITDQISGITDSFFFSNKIRSGIRIMLLGKPNVGKSSIYNSLMGYNRAIVSQKAGTTTDTIEATLEINGNKVILVDTAGYWESNELIESMGISKTRQELEISDLVLLVGESSEDFNEFDKLVSGKNIIKIASKSDINQAVHGCISVSTINNDGFSSLSTEISTIIKNSIKQSSSDKSYFINQRQKSIFDECLTVLNNLKKDMGDGIQKDIVANYLHIALETLNEIVSPISKDDIINSIFSDFCIGK